MPSNDPDNLDPDAEYVIFGEELQRIWRVAKRLYSMNRLGGEEMRRLAKQLDSALSEAVDGGPLDD